MPRSTLAYLIALLVLAPAAAGCFGKDDGDAATVTPPPTDDDDPPPTPTPSTTPTTPTDPTPTTSPEGNETEPPPPPPPPPQPVNETFTVNVEAGISALDPATGQGKFTVAEAGWASFTVTCSSTGSEFHADSVALSLKDSAGTEVGKATMTAAPPGDPAPAKINVDAAEPGEFVLDATAGTLSGGATLSCRAEVAY